MTQFAQDCPLPAEDSYEHAVQLRAPGEKVAPVTPAIRQEWVNGCAIVRFTVDPYGHVATAEAVREVPPGTGIPAADILRINRFGNASGGAVGDPMLIRVGMAEVPGGGTFVSLGFNDKH